MVVGIVTFPGSNGDADLRHALAVCGLRPRAIWHAEPTLGQVDAVMLPGGFAHGDYLRPGAIARTSPIAAAIVAFARDGGPVLGICNGFQILCELGLLPGALLPNARGRFVCREVALTVAGRETPFTRALGPRVRLPIAHGAGRWHADACALEEVEAYGGIVLRYADGSPNGATRDAAGVCNAAGNVVGMMPHPERHVEALLGGTDGVGVFRGLSGGGA
jgi:phosphoribosylformylglycinamidine synthase I